MTNNPTFEQYEEIGRQAFIRDFGRCFQRIQPETEVYSNFDLQATGNTQRIYRIEIKVRSEGYSIREYSGRTWIEATKLDYFQQVFKYYPNIICLYVVYFTDGICIYDITGRLQCNSSEVLHTFPINLPSTTATEGTCRNKWVGQLALNRIEYMDRIYIK